jgi:SagB-type dehydrogenase family enzyme
MIDERNIVNRMVDVVNRFGITSEDRALALTALHHDLSVFDIFGMLAVAGGGLVIPDSDLLLDPHHWLELVGDNRVTIWNSVPAFMQMLVETTEGEIASVAASSSSLRFVLLSGDWIPVDLPDRIRAVNQTTQVISLGGPTETTVWDICYPIGRVESNWSSIPYGRPMTNSRYYLLKDNLDDCPTWVTGELCIAGAGLSRGYWRDSDKTSQCFIAHPQTGERLYRSGDLGRYLPDGNIEILGRKDFQIKIRGNRIELGEIEAVLAQHPQVSNAVATVLDGPEGLKQLVAYAVLRDTASIAEASPNGANGGDAEAIAKLEFQLQQRALRNDPERLRVMLTKPPLTEAFLENHSLRQSHRKFQQQPVSLAQLSEFMSCLMQVEVKNSVWPKYRYPSAASLYPVQIYLYVKQGCVEDIPAGIYYYHPVEHDLVLLSPDAVIDLRVHGKENRQIFEDSAFSVFLVAQLSAIEPLYPEQAREFCLLEAGYISQLLMTVAPASQIGLCPIGGLDFEQIRSLFQLSDDHLFLHSLCGGIPAEVATNGAGHSTTEHDLQRFLGERIPQYMVPQHIVLLDSLPLTSNGKIDRKGLPLPASAVDHLAPETDLERVIAEVWQEVLQLESLSTNRSFFELGASSIHMVQARTKLQKLIGKPLSIVDLFRHPTISSFARFIGSPDDDQTLLDESSSRAQKRKSLRQRRPVRD